MASGTGRWSILAVGLLAGCQGRPSAERFIPAGPKARQALEAALGAWQRGAPHGAVPGTAAPVVEFVDSHHKPGQRLKSFAVLSVAPGDGPRTFSVRLTLEGPAEEVRARYVVVGLDPLWVIRHEDFEMLAHWDHPVKKP
jgi:hypothetical protein